MKNEALYQVSTLCAFQNKNYDGQISVGKMLEFGNTGFGTFHGLNGEMILINGVVYCALGDCSVVTVQENETTPFATLGFLENKKETLLTMHGDMSDLMNKLNEITNNPEKPILGLISGVFEKIVLHSVWPQVKPYEELKKIIDHQAIVIEKKIEGTLVGIRCPKSYQGLNVVGWHFHFLSKDLKIGGHVNDLWIEEVNISFDEKESLEVIQE